MTPDVIPIGPETRAALQELAARTGRPADELLAAAVEEYRRRLAAPVGEIPGVNPADIWASAAEADAGRLTPHAEVFAKLRGGR